MAVSNAIGWRIGRNRATRTETTTVTYHFERKPGGWQLPCGCIGPDIMSSDDAGESYCTFCGRGWMHMGRHNGRGIGSDRLCAMLDGKPQGQPVLILKDPLP